MALPRSESATILSEIRRCASLKKSPPSITSAARLNASLWSRIAPSTERSASRLCGSVRSETATSGIDRWSFWGDESVAGGAGGAKRKGAPPSDLTRGGRFLRLAFGGDFHFDGRG